MSLLLILKSSGAGAISGIVAETLAVSTTEEVSVIYASSVVETVSSLDDASTGSVVDTTN